MQIIFPHYTRRFDEDDLRNPTIAKNFAWTGREDYLDWVANWKATLREKIAEIRRLKTIRRDTRLDTLERDVANAKRQMLRVQCFNLLMLRTEGKRLSRLQREKRRLETA